QRNSQERQRLRLRRAVLDARAYSDLTGGCGVDRSAELAHVVRLEVPSGRERHAERRIQRGERPVESFIGGEIIAVVIHNLPRQDDHKSSRSRIPPGRETRTAFLDRGCWLGARRLRARYRSNWLGCGFVWREAHRRGG